MFQLIAQIQAEPVFLMSLAKPILVLAVLGPWAWLVGSLDKDAAYYYLKRDEWSFAHVGAGLVGFGVIITLPIFWVGLPLGIMILLGEVAGYIVYRNKQVPEKERWSGADIWRNIVAARKRGQADKAIKKASIKLLDKSEQLLDIPFGDDPRAEAFELFEKMLLFSVPRGADLLDMSVDAEKAGFIARIDGIRYKQEAPPQELCVQLIDYLKEHAGMDTTDRRRKQTGKMWVEVEDYGKHTLVLTTAGSTRQLSLKIEIDPDGRLDIPIQHLGLLGPQKQQVDDLLEQKGGVVLFASPPRTGTTTSMYSFLQKHDPYTSSVMTFEKETAFDLEGVNHNNFPEGASNEQIMEEFGSLLRSDPDAMMVSPLINTDMARTVSQYAEETRFYIPMPAKDTTSALKLWLKVVGDQKLAANALGAIISQRMVRRLCHTCRAPYMPDAAALKKLNVPKSKVGQLYKASGKVIVKETEEPCPDCHGLGYRGRIGVFEIMIIDQAARNYIASGEGEKLRAHLRKNRMVYLQEAALAKVVEGISDIKEVTRVMGEKD
ncbi:MAG: ATPase, T2SS/T4P/T4SS family [Planctomycetota bacterium]